jgi:hypothetical protein
MLAPSCKDNEGVLMNEEHTVTSPEPSRKTRVLRSEKSWRGIFSRHRTSGLAIDDFYRAEGHGTEQDNELMRTLERIARFRDLLDHLKWQ